MKSQASKYFIALKNTQKLGKDICFLNKLLRGIPLLPFFLTRKHIRQKLSKFFWLENLCYYLGSNEILLIQNSSKNSDQKSRCLCLLENVVLVEKISISMEDLALIIQQKKTEVAKVHSIYIRTVRTQLLFSLVNSIPSWLIWVEIGCFGQSNIHSCSFQTANKRV